MYGRAYHRGKNSADAPVHGRAYHREKNLTQEQLGELMGVQRAQVSRIENGHNLTVGTIIRAFKAMGVHAAFSFGEVSFSLC